MIVDEEYRQYVSSAEYLNTVKSSIFSSTRGDRSLVLYFGLLMPKIFDCLKSPSENEVLIKHFYLLNETLDKRWKNLSHCGIHEVNGIIVYLREYKEEYIDSIVTHAPPYIKMCEDDLQMNQNEAESFVIAMWNYYICFFSLELAKGRMDFLITNGEKRKQQRPEMPSEMKEMLSKIESIVRGSDALMSELSQTEKERVEIAARLRKIFPKSPIDPKRLDKLGEKEMERGREIARMLIGNPPNLADRLNELFRPPRNRSDRNNK